MHSSESKINLTGFAQNPLYKYCAFNQNALQGLIDDKVWLAKPDSFNDPFDCKFPMIREYSDKELLAHLNYCAKTQNKQELYTLEFIKEKGRGEYFDILEKYKKGLANAGVFSLSAAKPYEPLMWAHYADKHYGFCIEFERTATNGLCCDNCLEVNYIEPQDSVISILEDFLRTDKARMEAVMNILTSKTINWRYEREWRVIKLWDNPSDKEERRYQLDANILSIYFGLRMPRENALTIIRILQQYRRIKFYQITASPDRFSLEPKLFYFTEKELKT